MSPVYKLLKLDFLLFHYFVMNSCHVVELSVDVDGVDVDRYGVSHKSSSASVFRALDLG